MPDSLDRDCLEALLLFAAAKLLGKGAEHGLAVRAKNSRRAVILEATPDEVTAATTASQQLLATPAVPTSPLLDILRRIAFSDEEAEIVRIVGNAEVSANAIARHMGSESVTTRLRLLLSNLAHRGVLLSNTLGYRLAEPSLLPLAAKTSYANSKASV